MPMASQACLAIYKRKLTIEPSLTLPALVLQRTCCPTRGPVLHVPTKYWQNGAEGCVLTCGRAGLFPMVPI